MTKYKIFGLDFNLSGKDNIKIEFILEKDYMLDKKVDSIILIYDITNRSTYEKCNYYLDKIKKLKEETKTILVGNKADQEEKRNVSIEEATNFAALNNIIFFEISCAKNKNITKVIKCAIEYNNKIETREKEFINNKYKSQYLEKELKKLENSLIFRECLNEHEQIYDVIIDINSILSLNDKGWEIKYPKGKENYEKKIRRHRIIVGALGNRKKGKSFILSKLTEKCIGHSFWLKTEGISVFYGDKDDHYLAILDSAGQDDPLLKSEINDDKEENNKLTEFKEDNDKNKDKEEKETNKTELLEKSLRDKLLTEKFLEEFIIHMSDIIILVVGIMTLNEQILLTRIKNSLKNEKYLYVIHNLQNYQFRWQVEDYIENTLKKLYGIKIEENDFMNNYGDYYSKYFVERNFRVYHLLFINYYSDVANYYNMPTLEFLKKNIEVVRNRSYFSVIENCKEFFMKIQHDFLEETISKEDFEEVDNKIKVNKKKIKFKEIFIDEFSKIIINDKEIPNYYYYTEKNDLVINVELPGPNPSIKTKIQDYGEHYLFIFQGEKSSNTSDNKEKHIISKNLKDKTPFKFSIYISKKDITILPNDKGYIQFYERSEKNDQGLFTFKYHIASDKGDDFD